MAQELRDRRHFRGRPQSIWRRGKECAVTGPESTIRPWWLRLRALVEPALLIVTVAALVLGGIAWLFGWRAVADGCWVAGTLAAVCWRWSG